MVLVLSALCIVLAGCAARDNAAMAGLNNKFDHLIEVDARMRDDLKQYHEEGSRQDKRVFSLLDTVSARVGSVEGKITGLHASARDVDARLADLDTAVGTVRQRIGDFRGQQNVGAFSGGAVWVSLVAVAAMFVFHETLSARRAKRAGQKLSETIGDTLGPPADAAKCGAD